MNQFHEYFTNIAKTVTKYLPAMNHVLPESAVQSLFLYKTSCSEVISIIASLDKKLSSGEIKIHNNLVKLTNNVTVPYLNTVVNRSLDEGAFPDSLKTKVMPIYRKGSKMKITTARYN